MLSEANVDVIFCRKKYITYQNNQFDTEVQSLKTH